MCEHCDGGGACYQERERFPRMVARPHGICWENLQAGEEDERAAARYAPRHDVAPPCAEAAFLKKPIRYRTVFVCAGVRETGEREDRICPWANGFEPAVLDPAVNRRRITAEDVGDVERGESVRHPLCADGAGADVIARIPGSADVDAGGSGGG
ncbi:hypothetical protein [Dictyobacter aurantiacus]|uniref:hypothetical protein n=1 Tax=Dictyobacter aurantiacus TaxID=1936993 RepID=UPI000F828D70|nr:hypothetical protein [Dictyobacter aurantiacus]